MPRAACRRVSVNRSWLTISQKEVLSCRQATQYKRRVISTRGGTTMRSTILTLLAMAAPVIAQDDLRVLPAKSEPRKMLYQFQLAEAQKRFGERRETIRGLK